MSFVKLEEQPLLIFVLSYVLAAQWTAWPPVLHLKRIHLLRQSAPCQFNSRVARSSVNLAGA